MGRSVSFYFIPEICTAQFGIGMARKRPGILVLMHFILCIRQHQIMLGVLLLLPTSCPPWLTSCKVQARIWIYLSKYSASYLR